MAVHPIAWATVMASLGRGDVNILDKGLSRKIFSLL